MDKSQDSVRVLIAEDTDLGIVLSRALLEREVPNVEVFEARDGREALAVYRRRSPHLVLMDIQMPEMDGLEATREIRIIEHLESRTPATIVALTAGSESDDHRRSAQAGMDDCLTKPLTAASLAAVLKLVSVG